MINISNTTNKYRNKQNVRYLEGLFYEKVGINSDSAIYTLKDIDTNGFPSLYRLYMDEGDLTEWRFANKYLDGWEHWEMLTKCTWFLPFVSRWRKELELRTRSEALTKLFDLCEEPKASLTLKKEINKFIVEEGYKTKEHKKTSKESKPTKEEIREEANKMVSEKQRLKQDAERILN